MTRVLADALAKAFPDISVKISETHTDCMKYGLIFGLWNAKII